jgi:dihydrofolate reductase
MRTITADLFISLDGVIEAPENWIGPYFSDDVGQMIGTAMAQADTMLLGRVTYETFASSFGGQSGGMADQMNAFPKVVVSRTLERADWQNTTLLDSLAAVAEAKAGEGGLIAVNGSAGLVRSLLAEGLLDELRLLVFPVVVGAGKRLFDGSENRMSLSLNDCTRYTGGAVRLSYHPAG